MTAEIIMLNGKIIAQVTQEWVAIYNGTYNLDDIPVDIAVDKYGNSYVTGYSFTTGPKAVATIKYNPQGVYQWVKIYYDANMPENFPVGIVVDSLANVYITGFSGNINTNVFYTWTKKYNTSGDSLWTRYFFGTATYAQSEAIRIDKAGNIYVLGGNSGGQIFTVKYNSSGDSLWTRLFKQSGYYATWAQSLETDISGNVYIGGVSWFQSSNKYDYQVLKYNPQGTLLWSTTYGEANYNEYCYKMAVDNNSNVYLTGYQEHPVTSYDILTVNFNGSGTFQWARTYNRAVDYGYNVAVDYANNVIVTGSSSLPQNGPNFCTIKYNTNGDSQWVRIYVDTTSAPYDEAFFITVDSSNNVYVSGRSGFNNTFTSTIKYSANGIQQWKIASSGQLTSGKALAMDNQRNIFIISKNYYSGFGLNMLTIKYSQLSGIKKITSDIPSSFKLNQNYPNPFNSETTIEFDIPTNEFIEIALYDVKGAIVKKIYQGKANAERSSVKLNAENLSTGIYFCCLKSNGIVRDVKKISLIK